MHDHQDGPALTETYLLSLEAELHDAKAAAKHLFALITAHIRQQGDDPVDLNWRLAILKRWPWLQ